MQLVRPTQSEIEEVLDLIIKSDIAEYGEPDSELSDLQHEWGQIDLNKDAWLAKDEVGHIRGYAVLIPSRGELRLEVVRDPDYEPPQLGQELLQVCEERARRLAVEDEIRTYTFIAHVNLHDKTLFKEAGFAYVKSYYQMHIDLSHDLVQPRWPDGVQLRTAVPVEDDEAVYQAVQIFFEREASGEPTYEQWRTHMIRPDIYDPDLWFLATAGNEIVGTCLGIKYETEGWIRQFGVVPGWRGKGIATALLQHAFLVFRQRGYSRVGLGMEAQNDRALKLYDRVGMRVLRQYDEYQKVYPALTLNGSG